MSSRQADLLTVQALRAFAALLVVAYHAVGSATIRFTGSDTPLWANGSAGVDIFFVISGLVMVLSTQRLARGAHAERVFLRHRLIRIVPLYWLMTTAKIVVVLVLPQLVMRTQLDWPFILSSYALLPLHDAAGEFNPVLPVGWTLTYEMFFYLLVALALYLRQPILRIAGPVLCVVYLLAALRQPSWPNTADFAEPIVLEFLFGVAIAMALSKGHGMALSRGHGMASSGGHGIASSRGHRLPVALAALSLSCGTLLILTVPVISGLLRPFIWGLPAAMIVAGAVALEPVLAPRIPRWLLASGNASYAIYLTHGFVVPPVVAGVRHLGLPIIASVGAAVIGSVVASAAVGWVAHMALERPILALLRRRPAAVRPATIMS